MGLHYERKGSGPPLLLIHGLGASAGVWAPVVDRLSASRDVIAADLPGFGGSPPLADGALATAANLAASLSALCSEIGVERPHAAGNSLGGWVALELAKRGDAASATGISPAGLWRRPLGPRRLDRRRLGRLLRPGLKALLATGPGRRGVLGTIVARPELVPPDAARELVLGYLDAPGYEAADAAMRAEPFEHDGSVDVPVTLAWGSADRVVGRPSRTRMPPGAEFVEVPGWGHTPMWDDPEGVADLLLRASGG